MNYFFCKIHKTLFFAVVLGIIPKLRFFLQNPALSVFTLKAPELHEKFQKNSMSRFRKKGLSTDLPTY